MKFKRSEVFEMVDALFHKYASSYRNEAKEELADMIQRREDLTASQPPVEADAESRCKAGDHSWIVGTDWFFCPWCGEDIRTA